MKAIYIGDEYILKHAFTESVQDKVRKILPLDIHLSSDLKSLNDLEYTKLLHQYNIIIGAWGSRMLPDDYQAPENQYYCCLTGNFDGKVLPIHAERGLKLSNWGDAISHTIAESSLMMILGCLRRSAIYQDNIHNKKLWKLEGCQAGESLFNRKVGFLGFGLIAQELAKLLKPFSTELYAFDPYIPQSALDNFGVHRKNSVAELFSSAHIISNHSAKTAETNDIVNAEILALLPDTGVFVNTARGNSVDENALAAEHKKGRLFSALDVFKKEPLPEDHCLRGEKRCMLFSHQAGPTLDQFWRMGDHAVKNIKNYVEGKPLFMEITAQKMRIMT